MKDRFTRALRNFRGTNGALITAKLLKDKEKKKLSASFCKPEIRSKKIWNISVTSSCQSVEDSDLSLNAPQHRGVNLIWKQLQGWERDTRHKAKETKWSFLPSAHGWGAGIMVIKQKAKHFFQPLTNVVTQQLIRPLGLQAVKHHTSLFFFFFWQCIHSHECDTSWKMHSQWHQGLAEQHALKHRVPWH